MMIEELVADLQAETAALGELVLPLDAPAWDLATPAPGWSIRDQLTHLAFFDEALRLALVEPRRFDELVDDVRSSKGPYADAVARAHAHLTGTEVVAWFHQNRVELLAAVRAAEPAPRVPWFNGEKSLATMLSLRLTETWAHGQDVADALGASWRPTDRLRHVARLGHRTIGHSFAVNGRPQPTDDIRLELDAPGGDTWTFGDPDASDTVTGPAEDLCLVVTQRRHVADTKLTAVGPTATTWLTIAQIFAGAPGAGRRPGQFPA